MARDNKEVVLRHTQFAVRNEEELSKFFEAFPLLKVVIAAHFLSESSAQNYGRRDKENRFASQ